MANDSEAGVRELIDQLGNDARAVIRAEVVLAKAKLGERLGRYRRAAILFGAAGLLAVTALIALFVGAIMTLAPAIGAGLATLVVVGVALALAAVLALAGKARLNAGRAR